MARKPPSRARRSTLFVRSPGGSWEETPARSSTSSRKADGERVQLGATAVVVTLILLHQPPAANGHLVIDGMKGE